MKDVPLFVAMIVSTAAALSPHRYFATFPRSQGLSLFRSIAAEQASRYIPNRIVRARLALEDSSSFVIVGCDDQNERSVFVCTAIGCEVHRLDAVLWSHRKRQRDIFEDLLKWHTKQFPQTALVAGTLRDHELAAWNSIGDEL